MNKPITLLELKKVLTEKSDYSMIYLLNILRKVKNGVYQLKYNYPDDNVNLNTILSCELLSFLYQLFEEEFIASKEKDSPYFKIIIKIFLETFINYYSFMVFWFKTGLIQDKWKEFVIKCNKNQATALEMKINWLQDFEIRKTVFLF